MPVNTEVKKRGRSRKDGSSRSSATRNRSYWLGEVFVDQGWVWGTELVEVDPLHGKRRWEAGPLCLGREDDIVPILKG